MAPVRSLAFVYIMKLDFNLQQSPAWPSFNIQDPDFIRYALTLHQKEVSVMRIQIRLNSLSPQIHS